MKDKNPDNDFVVCKTQCTQYDVGKNKCDHFGLSLSSASAICGGVENGRTEGINDMFNIYKGIKD